MRPTPLSLDGLPPWASLHDVTFHSLAVRAPPANADNRGLVATAPLLASDAPLLRVPRDLILNAESVAASAKVDARLRALLDAAEGKVGVFLFFSFQRAY